MVSQLGYHDAISVNSNDSLVIYTLKLVKVLGKFRHTIGKTLSLSHTEDDLAGLRVAIVW